METLVRDLLERNKAGFIVLDGALRILRWSDDALKFSDDAAGVAVGRDIRDAFPEIAGAEAALAEVAAGTKGPWKLHTVSRAGRTGHPFFFDLTVQPAPPGTAEKLVALFEDVTSKTRLQQNLLQHSNESKLLLNTVTSLKNFYEQIIYSIGEALFVLVPDGTIVTTSAAAADLLGYNEGELIGRQIRSFIADERILSPALPLRNAEGTVINRAGETIPLSLTTSVVTDDDGKTGHMILLARDLREKKLAEEQISRLSTENVYLQEEVRARDFHEIVGQSEAIRKVFKQIEQVAGTDSTVLLLGETGTGKELIAHAIHRLSRRSDKLLVKVNCAVLPTSLIETELFGHEKGAFTGAMARRIGRFEFADKGTILLDEIGELPYETQAKLLRVLQEQEFERVGGTQPLHIDVRVIAATNRDLEEAVREGEFRSDLFFRVNIFPIVVPPLRERKEDIPLLVGHFVKKFSNQMRKSIETVHPRALDALAGYSWPGNVRELSAVIERAVIICDGNELKNVDITIGKAPRIPSRKPVALAEVEREHILEVLKEVQGTIEGPKGAAVRLGMNASTLRSKMKKLSIRKKGKSYE